MHKREFLKMLGLGAAAGLTLPGIGALARQGEGDIYDLPRFGNVHLLHMTDLDTRSAAGIS